PHAGEQTPAVRKISQPAVLDEQSEVVLAVLALRPAVAVAVRGERVGPRFLERLARALGDLGAEGVGSVIVERIFQPRMFAVRAVAPVALNRADRLRDR